MTFQETKLVLLSLDLAGYTRTVASLDAVSVAKFLDDWYRQCATEIRGRGGRVVKYIGDACLATFPSDGCESAVDAAAALVHSMREAPPLGFSVEVAARIHLSIVAEGEFGPDDDRRYDVLGSGVNHLFRMGGSPGIQISEPVYRQLPNPRRGAWSKTRPPATYSWNGR
jgi:adenylate cyclase